MAFNINVLKLPILKIGSTGSYVSAWQSFLKDAKYPVADVDGDFGKLAEQATRSYQQRNGLDIDGVVGNTTYTKAATQGFILKIPNLSAGLLLSYLGFSGMEVKDLQKSLNLVAQLNPPLTVDGVFGDTSAKGLAEAYKKRDVHLRGELEAGLSSATKQKLGENFTPAMDILNNYAKNLRFRLSGSQWINSFPTSKSISDLVSPFRERVEAFQKALIDAGCQVIIAATHRPKERAYLMHYAARIDREEIHPEYVPPMAGVEIDWVHYTKAGSLQAAKDMVEAYDIGANPVSLSSRHIQRQAIDWNITWKGAVNIQDSNGKVVTIDTPANSGSNQILWRVGGSYGVHKLDSDPPHWSVDGF